MNHSWPQFTFERVKIAIPVQQLVPFPNTESRNPTIHQVSNGETLTSQPPEIFRGVQRDHDPASGHHLKLQQFGPGDPALPFVSDALQDLAKIQIRQPQPVPLELRVN